MVEHLDNGFDESEALPSQFDTIERLWFVEIIRKLQESEDLQEVNQMSNVCRKDFEQSFENLS